MDDQNRSHGEALLQEAIAGGVDLSVIGGYGDRRMRERVMGSMTGHVFATAKLRVLMAH